VILLGEGRACARTLVAVPLDERGVAVIAGRTSQDNRRHEDTAGHVPRRCEHGRTRGSAGPPGHPEGSTIEFERGGIVLLEEGTRPILRARSGKVRAARILAVPRPLPPLLRLFTCLPKDRSAWGRSNERRPRRWRATPLARARARGGMIRSNLNPPLVSEMRTHRS